MLSTVFFDLKVRTYLAAVDNFFLASLEFFIIKKQISSSFTVSFQCCYTTEHSI